MQRLDKWLVNSRAVKTRTLAAAVVAEGRVRINGVRVETPAKPVKPGDVLTIALRERTLVWRVLGGAERRGPAAEAQALYEVLGGAEGGREARPSPAPEERPGRREREAIRRLLGKG